MNSSSFPLLVYDQCSLLAESESLVLFFLMFRSHSWLVAGHVGQLTPDGDWRRLWINLPER